MRRKKDTRERLLSTALQIISTSGLRGATARAVTQEAGVSLALVRYHFGSQQGLLKAAIEHAAADLFATADQMSQAESLSELLSIGLSFAGELNHRSSLRVLFEATLSTHQYPWLRDWSTAQIQGLRALVASKAPASLPEEQRVAVGLAVAALLDGALLHTWIDPDTDVQALQAGAALLLQSFSGSQTSRGIQSS